MRHRSTCNRMMGREEFGEGKELLMIVHCVGVLSQNDENCVNVQIFMHLAVYRYQKKCKTCEQQPQFFTWHFIPKWNVYHSGERKRKKRNARQPDFIFSCNQQADDSKMTNTSVLPSKKPQLKVDGLFTVLGTDPRGPVAGRRKHKLQWGLSAQLRRVP